MGTAPVVDMTLHNMWPLSVSQQSPACVRLVPQKRSAWMAAGAAGNRQAADRRSVGTGLVADVTLHKEMFYDRTRLTSICFAECQLFLGSIGFSDCGLSAESTSQE